MHCGREVCLGPNGCENWPKCRAETIPPWNCIPAKSTATVCVREQDVLEAADRLSQFILDEMPNVCLVCIDMAPGMICETCRWNRLGVMAENYQNERKGIRR